MPIGDTRATPAPVDPLIAEGRFDPPWVRELATALKEPEEHIPTVLRRRAAHGGLYQLVKDFFLRRQRLTDEDHLCALSTNSQSPIDGGGSGVYESPLSVACVPYSSQPLPLNSPRYLPMAS
jgi:hypothetical protein